MSQNPNHIHPSPSTYHCPLISFFCPQKNFHHQNNSQPHSRRIELSRRSRSPQQQIKMSSSSAPQYTKQVKLEDNLGFDAEVKTAPPQPKLTRQVAFSMPNPDENEDEQKYVLLMKTAQQILRNRCDKKMNDLEKQSGGVDEMNLRPQVNQFLINEIAYLQEFLLPQFRDDMRPTTCYKYSIEELLLFWDQCPEILKLYQGYNYLMRDLHETVYGNSRPYLHLINEALNAKYQKEKEAKFGTKNPRATDGPSDYHTLAKKARFAYSK